MKNKGFSLVELLIVLSVMAALIAVMIPIGMNALRKAKAVKVARNLKSLAETAQNIIMLEGIDEIQNKENLYDYTGNVTDGYQLAIFDASNGEYHVCASYLNNDVSTNTVCEILPDIDYAGEEYKISSESKGYFYKSTTSIQWHLSTNSSVLAPLNSLYYAVMVTGY
ncbi:MAG: type II secretion system protein [Petrotogales bacterium]